MIDCPHERVREEPDRCGFGQCLDCGKRVYDDFNMGWMTFENLRQECKWRDLWTNHMTGHV